MVFENVSALKSVIVFHKRQVGHLLDAHLRKLALDFVVGLGKCGGVLLVGFESEFNQSPDADLCGFRPLHIVLLQCQRSLFFFGERGEDLWENVVPME